MQCVILAAGFGTRMRHLSENTPKSMVRVFDKPLLEYKIEMLPDNINEVILIIGHLGEQIRAYFGNEWKGRKIKYTEQETANGTGAAIHCAKHLLSGKFLVTNGDDFYSKEDLAILTLHDLAVLVYKTETPRALGILNVDEKGNYFGVKEKLETPTLGLINAGAYVLDADYFNYPLVPISEKEFGLPQTLSGLSRDRPVKIEVATGWLSISSPEDIPAAEDFIRRQKS